MSELTEVARIISESNERVFGPLFGRLIELGESHQRSLEQLIVLNKQILERQDRFAEREDAVAELLGVIAERLGARQ